MLINYLLTFYRGLHPKMFILIYECNSKHLLN